MKINNPATDAAPSKDAFSLLGDRKKLAVIHTLLNGTKRFTEIRRACGDIGQKPLTACLRALESDGLLVRKAYPEVPPRVEYTLTPTGYNLKPVFREISKWYQDRSAQKEAHE